MTSHVPEPLRVVLVDDEPLARMRMRALLAQADSPCEVMGEFGDAPSALQALRLWDATASGPDLLFLDIAMPGPDGLQLARQLTTLSRVPLVVFVTAHAEHAVSAFDLEAVDYLTKPIRLDRLNMALARAVKRLSRSSSRAPGDEVILIHERDKLIRVAVRDVLYFKAESKSVTLTTATQSHVVAESLSELAQRLGARFIRVHRNALVACQVMSRLERRADADADAEGWAVLVEPVGEWLAVSRRQIQAVKEAMASHGK